MIIEGSVDLYDTKQHDTEVGETPDSEAESTSDIFIVIGGVVLVLLCILFFGLYIRMVLRRKGCPCFPSKEQRLARQLDNQVGNGQVRNSCSIKHNTEKYVTKCMLTYQYFKNSMKQHAS
jgi:hypothetical protein